MERPEASGGRRRRLLRMRWIAALVVVTVPLTFPTAGASFAAVTADEANSVSSADVAAPSELAAAQTCAVPGIARRSSSSAASSAGSVTLPVPAGKRSGDVLVVQFTNRFDKTAHPVSISSGTWTETNRTTRGVAENQLTSGVYWKLATGSEPASITFSVAAAVEVTGSMHAYSGADATTPVHAVSVGTGSSTSAATGSFNLPYADAMLVHVFAKRAEALPAPTGLPVRSSLLSPTSDVTHGATVTDEVVPGTGSTTVRTATGSLSTGWIVQSLALRPGTTVVPSATLGWTASPTAGVTGYQLERLVPGTVTRSWIVTPGSVTGTTDAELTSGTTYTYRLRAYAGTWVSPTVATTLTPSC